MEMIMLRQKRFFVVWAAAHLVASVAMARECPGGCKAIGQRCQALKKAAPKLLDGTVRPIFEGSETGTGRWICSFEKKVGGELQSRVTLNYDAESGKTISGKEIAVSPWSCAYDQKTGQRIHKIETNQAIAIRPCSNESRPEGKPLPKAGEMRNEIKR